MKNKKIRIAVVSTLCLVMLAVGVFAMLILRKMYQSIHQHINSAHLDVEYNIEGLNRSIDSMEAQLNLAVPDMYENVKLNYDWVQKNTLIAHAFGGVEVDGVAHEYTNSLEAFHENYAKGMRVFEADFQLSSDGVLVAVHDWERYGEDKAMSYVDFKRGSFFDNKLTQMTGEDIVDLMIQYPDIYIVTDSKFIDLYRYRLQFSQLVYLAYEKNAPEILDRMIIQVYNQGMYGILYNIYPWKSVIYTLYQSPDDMESVRDFCVEHGIQVVTMSYERVTEDIVSMMKDAGIMIFTHTVNDIEEAHRERELGVTGFYTDFLFPAAC